MLVVYKSIDICPKLRYHFWEDHISGRVNHVLSWNRRSQLSRKSILMRGWSFLDTRMTSFDDKLVTTVFILLSKKSVIGMNEICLWVMPHCLSYGMKLAAVDRVRVWKTIGIWSMLGMDNVASQTYRLESVLSFITNLILKID